MNSLLILSRELKAGSLEPLSSLQDAQQVGVSFSVVLLVSASCRQCSLSLLLSLLSAWAVGEPSLRSLHCSYPLGEVGLVNLLRVRN